MNPRREKIQQGAAAVSLASFQLSQKLFNFLIESKVISAKTAIALIRDAAMMEEDSMDESGHPANAAAAHLLTQYGKSIAQKYHLPWPK